MLPAFLPQAQIVKRVSHRGRRMTVGALCREAGIECRVTGPGVGRKIYIQRADKLGVAREPGTVGAVAITLDAPDKKARAFLALGILAYVVFDYVARESVRGLPEMRTALPRGRSLKPRVLSGAERQRRWRIGVANKVEEGAK